MSAIILVNTATDELAYGTSGSSWVEMDVDNDYLIFSEGNDTVADGEALPTQTQLNQAGTLISASVATTVSYCFLADISTSKLDLINNAGNQNKQYAFCAYFDAATASEPVLEMWDDSDLDTTAITCLGAGTPANSWFKGVTTTDAAPGADWTGSPLAGTTDGNFLYLNDEDGALGAAGALYWNLKVTIPAAASSSLYTPVCVLKFTQN